FYAALREQLRDFAERTFALDAPGADGASLRESLEGLIGRSIAAGKPPAHRERWEAELACPPLPDGLGYLWRMFRRLSARRGGNGFGVNPIRHSDIEAFCRLTRMQLDPWEVEAIEDLDGLFLAEQARAAKERAS